MDLIKIGARPFIQGFHLENQGKRSWRGREWADGDLSRVAVRWFGDGTQFVTIEGINPSIDRWHRDTPL